MRTDTKLLFIIMVLASCLRLFMLSSAPAGLNADEAALGYNAYSLIQTGADEHKASWPLVFRSFDDYKPPLYVYLSIPFIYFLGLTTFAVRLPSALLGVATVYLTYLLVNELFKNFQFKHLSLTKNTKLNIGHLASFLLAISPWHLHFSRGAWEVNVSLFFLTLAIYGYIKGLKQPRWYLLSSIAFVAALYTYHSIRLIAPLIFLSMTVSYGKTIITQLKQKNSRIIITSSLLLGLIFLLPLAKQMLSSEGQSRFSGVSIFADSGPLWQALEQRRLSPDPDALITRLKHNKYLSYTNRFVENYLSHFSPDFLFVNGDEIARSKVPGFGQSYLILLPFYGLGILALLFLNSPSSRLVLSWFLIAPLAAALTFQSPHALRSQNLVIPLNIIISLGAILFFTWVNRIKPKSTLIIFTLLVFLVIQSHFSYLKKYYVDYPRVYPYAWQYGFDQLVNYVEPIQDDYQTIIISDRYDQPYILMAYFLKYDPAKLQKELVFSNRDNFGFSTGRAFGNFQFHKIDWAKDSLNTKALIVVADEIVPDDIEPLHVIYYKDNSPVFRLYQTH